MNHEWVLSQLLSRYSTQDILSLFPSTVINEMRPIEECIPFEVLVHVLTFVPNQFVFNLMRVCKRWYTATQEKSFWMCRVRTELRRRACNETYVTQLDPFFLHNVPMLFRVGWMIRPDLIKCTVASTDRYDVRFHNSNFDYLFCFDHSKKKLVFVEFDSIIRPINGQRGIWRHGECKKYSTSDGGIFSTLEWFYDTPIRIAWLKGKCKNGHAWDGCGIILDAWHYRAHGKGTWTLSDGRTHSGDNVALAGELHGIGVEGLIFYGGYEIKNAK